MNLFRRKKIQRAYFSERVLAEPYDIDEYDIQSSSYSVSNHLLFLIHSLDIYGLLGLRFYPCTPEARDVPFYTSL